MENVTVKPALELDRLRTKCLAQPAGDWLAQQVLILIRGYETRTANVCELAAQVADLQKDIADLRMLNAYTGPRPEAPLPQPAPARTGTVFAADRTEAPAQQTTRTGRMLLIEHTPVEGHGPLDADNAVVDGFGLPFDPAAHRRHLANPQPVPDPPAKEPEPYAEKDKPAGSYAQGSGV